MRPIYLDYNATTPISPPVQEAMLPFLAEHYGHSASSHALGRACAEAIEDARGRVALLLGADADEIVFTSGGTESNNLAILGTMLRRPPERRGHLVICTLEHPAVAEPVRLLQRWGYQATIVPCDRRGLVDPQAVAAALRPQTQLVSIVHANHEIGTIQPLARIAEICRQREIPLHTDAAQSVGKIWTRVGELGVDLLSLSGHKLYAPKGVGALYVRGGTPLEPILRGPGNERGLRAGTENVPGIVALGRAATLLAASIDSAGERLLGLRDRLLTTLHEALGDQLVVHGLAAPRLPNTLSIALGNVHAGRLLARIPELCAFTSAGDHDGAFHASATLSALGLSPAAASATLRLSLGWYTSQDDVDRAANLLIAAWEDLR